MKTPTPNMSESESGDDPRIYQRRNGTRYIKPEEFVRSEAGQKLLERFNKHV